MVIATGVSGEQVRLYVAMDGDDAWSGTLKSPNAAKDDGPFATLHCAVQAVRQTLVKGFPCVVCYVFEENRVGGVPWPAGPDNLEIANGCRGAEASDDN